jgi:hypothetical protein
MHLKILHANQEKKEKKEEKEVSKGMKIEKQRKDKTYITQKLLICVLFGVFRASHEEHMF